MENFEKGNGLIKILSKDGKLITTSVNVSLVFGKRHSDVLRAIENLKMSNDFRVRNFAQVTYKDSNGDEHKKYEMNRDGWSLLVMGFTGEKAVRFKEAYINLFNEMEKSLKEMSISNPPLLPNFNDPVAAARAWADAKEQELKAKLELKKQEHLVHIANEFLTVEDSLKGTDEIAKELKIGEITLFKILRAKGVFHYVYQNNKKVNVPYQKHIDAGRVVVKNKTTDIGQDEEKKINYSRSYFTPKGEAYVCSIVKNLKDNLVKN